MVPWLRLALFCWLILPLHALDQPPVFPKAFTGLAEFETTAGFKQAGWASLTTAAPGGGAYIVSTRYLLGPGGGFAHQIAGENVASFVRSIQINSLAGEVHGYIVHALPVAAPDMAPLKTPLDDLTIYEVHGAATPEPVVPLATELPAKGDTVWFMAQAPGGTAISALAGVVTSNASTGWLTVKLKSGALDPKASGLAVLNSAGELVGVYSHEDGADATTLDVISALTIAQALPSGKS